MNLQHLKYAVEVEQTGSITGAAQKLYMSQPHLSRAIRELESEMHFPIFERTTRGMVPTKEGKEFLFFAKDVLKRMEDIGRLKARMAGRRQICSIHSAGGACLSAAFREFAASSRAEAEEYHYLERESRVVVQDTAAKRCRYGIVRCQEIYGFYYQNLFREKNLAARELWQYSMAVWTGKDHPLAGKEELTYLDMREYPEIRYQEDGEGKFEEEVAGEPAGKVIFVSSRWDALELLTRIRGSYLWDAPMPPETQSRWGIAPSVCHRPGNQYRDYLICRQELEGTAEEKELLTCLKRAASRTFGLRVSL